MIEKLQFKDYTDAQVAADEIMKLNEVSTDNVWKRGDLTILAPTQNIFAKHAYDRIHAGEQLTVSELKDGLTSYGKKILMLASVLFIALPDGITLTEIKCRYPAGPQLVQFYHGVMNAHCNQNFFHNGLK
jgi:hypothetical protein